MNDGTTQRGQYEVAYGNKYEATKGMNRAQLAKLIREDIKAAVKAGALPKAKYSVRKRDFSGGGSIDINVSHVEEPGFVLFNPERVRFDIEHDSREFTRLPLYSERMASVLKACEDIMRAYNYDGSDISSDYFHVRFYGHATVGWEWERDVRAVEFERMKDTLATEAAARLAKRESALDVATPAPAIVANDTKPTPVAAQVDFLASLGVS